MQLLVLAIFLQKIHNLIIQIKCIAFICQNYFFSLYFYGLKTEGSLKTNPLCVLISK